MWSPEPRASAADVYALAQAECAAALALLARAEQNRATMKAALAADALAAPQAWAQDQIREVELHERELRRLRALVETDAARAEGALRLIALDAASARETDRSLSIELSAMAHHAERAALNAVRRWQTWQQHEAGERARRQQHVALSLLRWKDVSLQRWKTWQQHEPGERAWRQQHASWSLRRWKDVSLQRAFGAIGGASSCLALAAFVTARLRERRRAAALDRWRRAGPALGTSRELSRRSVRVWRGGALAVAFSRWAKQAVARRRALLHSQPSARVALRHAFVRRWRPAAARDALAGRLAAGRTSERLARGWRAWRLAFASRVPWRMCSATSKGASVGVPSPPRGRAGGACDHTSGVWLRRPPRLTRN